MTKNSLDEGQAEDLVIQVDRDLCISCSTCIALAPGTFELDEEMKCSVKNSATGQATEILNVAESCPVGAIKVIDKKLAGVTEDK